MKKFKMLISVVFLFIMCGSMVFAAPGTDAYAISGDSSETKISGIFADTDYVILEELKEGSSRST
ncbi:MAG: hypothetical protein K1W28_08355 [Lachnospiraceae bacterium]